MNRRDKRANAAKIRKAPPETFRCEAMVKAADGKESKCGAACTSQKGAGKSVTVFHAKPHCDGYTTMPMPDWMRKGDVP
jgi:hypothetical protein